MITWERCDTRFSSTYRKSNVFEVPLRTYMQAMFGRMIMGQSSRFGVLVAATIVITWLIRSIESASKNAGPKALSAMLQALQANAHLTYMICC